MLTLKNVIHTSIIEARKEAGVALAVISENRLLAVMLTMVEKWVKLLNDKPSKGRNLQYNKKNLWKKGQDNKTLRMEEIAKQNKENMISVVSG